MQWHSAGARATEAGTDRWFTGAVGIDELAVPPRPSALRVHRVTFQPGARTRWHTHPLGQVLVGSVGEGLVATETETVRLTPGASVWIAPGARHWHGARPDQLFAHLAIQEATAEGHEADWGDPVRDADYFSAAARASTSEVA